MKLRMKAIIHIAVLEVEALALLVVLVFACLHDFLPTGWMSTDAGDCLRFRFATGQDELVRKCRRVQVAFLTKDCPRAFENPKLTVRKDIDAADPYGWVEVPAPPGSCGFRFDVHRIRRVEPLVHGPDIAEIYLGKRKLNWAKVKAHYQYDRTWQVPCYWYQPRYFLNFSKVECIAAILLYFLGVSLFVWMCVAVGHGRKCGRS